MARTHVDLDDCPAGADLLDSRDLAARLEALREERDRLRDALTDAEDEYSEATRTGDAPEAARVACDVANDDYDEFGAAYEHEILDLEEMEQSGIPDWHDGETLIHERHFTDYCRDLVDDIGDLPRDLPHYIVIDWEATADNLRADYTEFTYAGHTYLVRA